MKNCGSISVNSNKNLYPIKTKQIKNVNFKGGNVQKTLDSIAINAAESKYFKNGEPILTQYVPQGYFGVQKFLGEASRFLGIDAVANCTKLVMHDATTNTGFLAHVDSNLRMTNQVSIENIQKTLKDINPLNLLVRHLKGSSRTSTPEILEKTFEFMKRLGIPEHNLIEQDLESFQKGSRGLFLDIKTGQTYNTEMIHNPQADEYQNLLNTEESEGFLKRQLHSRDMNTYIKTLNTNYLANINEVE